MINKYSKFKDKLLNEGKLSKILYHGSPYVFKNFSNKTTFFTDDKTFAVDYSEQKSFEGAMDASAKLYTVEVIGNIFDATNEKELTNIEKILPSEIEYSYNNFGFNAKVPKKEFLLNLTGYDIIEPIDNINDLEIGDTFPDPTYPVEEFIIIKKDEKNVYVILEKRLKQEIFDSLISNKDVKELVINFAKEKENTVQLTKMLSNLS